MPAKFRALPQVFVSTCVLAVTSAVAVQTEVQPPKPKLGNSDPMEQHGTDPVRCFATGSKKLIPGDYFAAAVQTEEETPNFELGNFEKALEHGEVELEGERQDNASQVPKKSARAQRSEAKARAAQWLADYPDEARDTLLLVANKIVQRLRATGAGVPLSYFAGGPEEFSHPIVL